MDASSDSKKELLIAVVDDNDLSRRSIVEILEEDDYNVVGSASNAGQAFEVLLNKRPNIMIIDVIMPETSGIQLAKEVIEKYADTNIIMMSTLDSQNVIIESISNGAVDFLRKPFKKETLIDSLEKIRANIERGI